MKRRTEKKRRARAWATAMRNARRARDAHNVATIRYYVRRTIDAWSAAMTAEMKSIKVVMGDEVTLEVLAP